MRLIIITIALFLAACSTQTPRGAAVPADPETAAADAWPEGAGTGEADVGGAGGPHGAASATGAAAEGFEDAWQHIRSELELERFTELRGVQDKLAWYRRNQEYLDRVVPQVVYLTVGFFVSGVLLLVLGSRLAPSRPSARP